MPYMLNCVRSKLYGVRILRLNIWTSNLPRKLSCLMSATETDNKVLNYESSLILKNQSAFLNNSSNILCRYYSDEVKSDTFELPRTGADKEIRQARERQESRVFASNHGEITDNKVSRVRYSESINDQRHREVTENQTLEYINREMCHSQTSMKSQSDSNANQALTKNLEENTDSQALSENQTHLNPTDYSTENESVTVVAQDPSNELPLSELEGDWSREMSWVASQETRDVLLPPRDAAEIDVFAPELRPSFNFAAYINKSPTLQQLVKLGVDLSQWEKRREVGSFILRLDFEADMKQFIMFLHDTGVPAEDLGRWLTVNPFIFREQLEDLEARVNYLEVMGFTPAQITRIVTQNPYWLLFSTVRIDHRLGFFQRTFELTGDEVRALATKQPRLITIKFSVIKQKCFSVLEEMGFTKSEMKSLLLSKPRLWLANGVSLMRRFDFAHNVMGLSHDQLLQFPHVLTSREFRLKQRHSYLKSIGRAQYNPKLPGYVSPQQLVTGDDVFFCTEVAKTSVQDFNDFLKTI